MVSGEKLTDAELAQLKSEDDSGFITVNGQVIAVEQQNFTGTAGNDNITETADADNIYGLAGNDTLNGSGGIDGLHGDDGNDSLIGGAGNDLYGLDRLSDVTTENANEGTDTVQSSVTYTLGTNLENLTLIGTTAINGTGNAANNILIGNSASNNLSGLDGNDSLNGASGIDTLTGGNGNDTLIGGAGSDNLTGGTGTDFFVFNAPTENIDQIQDFSLTDDTIRVSARGFRGGLVANSALSSAQFIVGSSATNASQRFIYNSATGNLFFDVDGNGATASVQIATLVTKPLLTASDIFITI